MLERVIQQGGGAVTGEAWVSHQRAASAAAVLAAESPAEAALLVFLYMARDGAAYAFGGEGCSWRMRTQLEVKVERATYRLDIALERGPHRVAVEVDGHAYHHATEAQAARDAARDFALMATGWKVIRVDAWSVFKDPAGVVSDLQRQLLHIETTASRRKRPVEEQSDEEFAQTISVFEAAIRAYPDVAHENAAKLRSLRAQRERVRVVRALLEREASGSSADVEAENELLRNAFDSTRARLGIEVA